MEVQLVQIENNQVVVSSRQIAKDFGKEHKVVLRSVREILAEQNCAAKFFYESTYDNRGKEYPEYLMNRDVFSLLVMGFTGSKALEWKVRYIQAFNAAAGIRCASNTDKSRRKWKFNHVVSRNVTNGIL